MGLFDSILTFPCLQNIKENIEGHAVDWYSDVFDLVFPDVDADAANSLWKERLREPPERKDRGGRSKSEDLEENIVAGY